MTEFIYNLNVLHGKLTAFLAPSEERLHTARFARLHELEGLSHNNLLRSGLILGLGKYQRILQVVPTKNRRELGNALIVAPTRGGKGLLAVSQLLSWPHSVIVNDIKGELYNQTVGYRKKLGDIFVIDPLNTADHYDPLNNKTTESQLQSAATNLLHKPNEGEGAIFTQRAIVMLTQLFLAAKREQIPLLPYARTLVRLGLFGAATRLNAMSPDLATQFLDIDYQYADFNDKFLVSCWGTLSARIRLLLTENTVECFRRSDFTANDIMQGARPVTIYLKWPERDLVALSPLVRLIWKSLIDEMVYTHDAHHGLKPSRPVLLLVDEAGRSSIPALPEYATTINGRGISLWIAIQSLSQLDAVYGRSHARILRDNMDSQIFYRPCDQETAEYIEKRLGFKSGFAHSESKHTDTTSKGLSEQRVPLMTASEIMQMADDDIIGFHRNLRPFKAKRMDWRKFSLLTKRNMVKPDSVGKENIVYALNQTEKLGSTVDEACYDLSTTLLRP